MSAARPDGATLAAISAAVDAFLREESESAARADSARRRSVAISAWRMAARTAFGARGYGAGAGWRGVD